MNSSYEQNGYGSLFTNYILSMRFTSIVELGVGNGYSTIHLAQGLKYLHLLHKDKVRILDAYDLFENYPYKHSTKELILDKLKQAEVSEYVNLQQGNAYEVYTNYADRSIEFLHVDISNTGDTVNKIMELWHPKMSERSFIAFEGGSIERDNVEWMKKYNMPSIKQAIDTNEIIRKFYVYGTYFLFPSITLLYRNYDDYARN